MEANARMYMMSCKLYPFLWIRENVLQHIEPQPLDFKAEDEQWISMVEQSRENFHKFAADEMDWESFRRLVFTFMNSFEELDWIESAIPTMFAGIVAFFE